MKKIIMFLFFAAASLAAQTGCITGSGVTCSSNLNLWLLPQHYQNWGVPWNDNATAIDAFSLTVPLLNPTATQTIDQPSGTYFNVNNLFVYGTPAVIRFALTPGTQDGSLSRTGAGTFSLDSSVAGNGLGILTLGGIKLGGSTGASGQGLCSDGTSLDMYCDFVSGSTAFYYQTVSSDGTAQTQRSVLNFSSNFTTTDSSSPSETTVDLSASGTTAGTYAYASNITVDTYGRITAITSGTATAAVISITSNTSGVIYQNTTGRNVFLSVVGIGHSASYTLYAGPTSDVSNALTAVYTSDAGGSAYLQITGIIPPNWYYEVTGGTVDHWTETEM